MPMYKLIFYVPESHLEQVKSAVFAAGAGHAGNYDRCCWQVLGTGQFRPLAGSDAFIGELNQLTQVSEYRVEMVCKEALIKAVVAALRQAHPYEEPAYDVLHLLEVEDE